MSPTSCHCSTPRRCCYSIPDRPCDVKLLRLDSTAVAKSGGWQKAPLQGTIGLLKPLPVPQKGAPYGLYHARSTPAKCRQTPRDRFASPAHRARGDPRPPPSARYPLSPPAPAYHRGTRQTRRLFSTTCAVRVGPLAAGRTHRSLRRAACYPPPSHHLEPRLR